MKDIKTTLILHPEGLPWGWLFARVPLVLDVETWGLDPKNGKLTDISLCSPCSPKDAYNIVLQWFDHQTSTWHVNPHYNEFIELLRCELPLCYLIGHNYSYDKAWIDHVIGIDSKWHACTRLMWHMASAPSGPRGYGLKDAQLEVLGWTEKGSTELEAQIVARGSSIKAGGHYLADKEVRGHYACLDTASTAALYNELSRFFDDHRYWWMLEKMMRYSWLLHMNTVYGVNLDRKKLTSTLVMLEDTAKASEAQFMEILKTPIERMERSWREHRATRYTFKHAREKFLASWELQNKYKLTSDKSNRELFYEELKLKPMQETPGGLPSVAMDAITASIAASGKSELKEIGELYEQYSKSTHLITSFVKPWLQGSLDGRIHPGFNPCGTVSYRISGRKPYFLNAPFDEKEVMSCLTCDEGWEGVHADFSSIEPCVTAHYSQDPNLLKVFRDGKGDVYLDLALSLFPTDTELARLYRPEESISSEVKEALKKQRKIAKIIQLAVQYTGTEWTVSKNLTFAGVPTTRIEAREMVQSYHKHFYKVRVMDEVLFKRFERDGYLRNAVGRIIRVPTVLRIRKKDGTYWDKPHRYKDLPNRFIQSSAHDLLSFWVLIIDRMLQERHITAKPVLLDCHDSTSWQAPKEQIEGLEQVFKDALTELNETVKMSVPVKMEMKRFTTLAGLKGSE